MTDKTELRHQRLTEVEKAELLSLINRYLTVQTGLSVRRILSEVDRLRAALRAVTDYWGPGKLGPKYEKEREVMRQCREALEK